MSEDKQRLIEAGWRLRRIHFEHVPQPCSPQLEKLYACGESGGRTELFHSSEIRSRLCELWSTLELSLGRLSKHEATSQA